MPKPNFKTVKFGDLADFKNGLNFSLKESGYNTKVLGVGDFQARFFMDDFSDIKEVSLSSPVKKADLLKDGDLVFVRSNGNKALVGRCLLVYPGKDDVSFSGFTIRGRITSKEVIPEYIGLLMQAGLLKQALKRQGRGTNISNLNQGILSGLELPIPSLEFQREILSSISAWNEAIEKTEKLIAVKEKQFEWLSATLICKSGHKKKDIAEFANEVSQRNKGNACDTVLSVTNQNGFVLPEDRFQRRVASEDLSNYKVVSKGQYAYNPSRINVGSIARLDEWPQGVLSPMYVIFKIDEKKLNSDYFLHWLSSFEAKQRIRKSAQGSVRETVNFKELCALPLPYPSLEKQKEIARTLNSARNEIDLLKNLAAKYQEQKHGLMQKLLSGEWRIKTKEAA